MDNISTEPLLCIGFPAWEGTYQKSTVMLMEALSTRHPVLYVEYPFTWKDVLHGIRKGNRPVKRMVGLQPRLREMRRTSQGQLHVLTLPPILPINRMSPGESYERWADFNARYVAPTIKRSLRQLGFSRYQVMYAFNPFLGAFLHSYLTPTHSIYYCYDEIGAANWTANHGPYLEQRLLKKMDGIVTSSLPLLLQKAGNIPGKVIKNGVNIDLFSQAYSEQVRKTSTPTLGYLGSIDSRVDVQLLLKVLEAWPEARLLMVGRITDPVAYENLKGHLRVSLIGPQPPEKLPLWLKQMDVGLIPFVHNDFTRFIYPLKINEYLAAGLPVVSTHFGDLSDFEGIASIADDPVEFKQACQQAFENDTPVHRQQRKAFAAGQSWQGRAAELLSWLSSIQHKEIVGV